MLLEFYILLLVTIFTEYVHSYVTSVDKRHVEDGNSNQYLDSFKNRTLLNKIKEIKHINDSVKSPNLISNVFDTMLSNEMLAIKKKNQENYVNYGSTVFLTFKNNVQTPTLELKQKWPIQGQTSAEKDKYYTLLPKNSAITKILQGEGVINDESNLADHNKNKVIEVRSYSAHTTSNGDTSFELLQTKRHCRTTKSNFETIGSGSYHEQEEKINSRICSHEITGLCTRTTEMTPITNYYPYYFYSPYFVGVTTDNYYTYFHSGEISDVKAPKYKKHRKNKKPYIYEETYLEENSDILDNDVYENFNKYNKDSTLSSGKYDNEDDVEDVELLNKLKKGHIEIIDRAKFVDEVVNDLKEYYSDTVIKDCYCSLSFNIPTNNLAVLIMSYLPIIFNIM